MRVEGMSLYSDDEVARLKELVAHAERFNFNGVRVEPRAEQTWSVVWLGCVLERTGKGKKEKLRWVFDPQPSDRSDKLKKTTRFTLNEAVELAKKVQYNTEEACEKAK
jgi:hypothetical protein